MQKFIPILTFNLLFQHGNTALHEAAWKGFSHTVEVLCKNKSNYYLRNRGGFSALHLCCQNGHNESCRVLLRAGCKPNIKNTVSPKNMFKCNNTLSKNFRQNFGVERGTLWWFIVIKRQSHCQCNFMCTQIDSRKRTKSYTQTFSQSLWLSPPNVNKSTQPCRWDYLFKTLVNVLECMTTL